MQLIQDCCVYSGEFTPLFETSSLSRCLKAPDVYLKKSSSHMLNEEGVIIHFVNIIFTKMGGK